MISLTVSCKDEEWMYMEALRIKSVTISVCSN